MKRAVLMVLLLCGSACAGEFGYTTIGSLSLDMSYVRADTATGYILTAAANTDIDSLSVAGWSTGGTGSVAVGVYKLSDYGLLDSSGTIVLTATTGGAAQWETVAVSIQLVEGETYFLAVGNEAGDAKLMWEAAPAGGGGFRNTSTNELPATITSEIRDGTGYSIRAVYSIGMGGGTGGSRVGILR